MEQRELSELRKRIELFQGDTNERLDRLEQVIEKQCKRLEHIEAVQAEHSERFDRLEHRIDGLEERMGGMDKKLDTILQLLQK